MSGADAYDMDESQPAQADASVSRGTAGAETVDIAPPRRRRGGRLSRWLRRIAFGLLILCLLVTLSLWVVTRSWFIILQVKPILESKLGGEVTIGRATWHSGGRITLDDVMLRAPGLRGPAAEIAHVANADVHVSLAGLLSGTVLLDNVKLAGVTVRLSEDRANAGRMNFMALTPKHGEENRPMPPPPRVRITDLALEVGTHNHADFSRQSRRLLTGEMHPMEGQGSWYAYELAETDENGAVLGDKGLFIKGEWNPHSNEMSSRIETIVLDERVNGMLPAQARLWWDLMDLKGRVDGVIINWQPDQPLSVRFSVNNIGLTIPVDLSEVWSLYRNGDVVPTTTRPRMNVHSGQIRVAVDSLLLDQLTGELISTSEEGNVVGVPYEISLSVPKLPSIDWQNTQRWMQDALKTSAFDLTARLDNFSLAKTPEGESEAVGLPTIVARTLAKFQTTNWVLSTNVRMSRGEPSVDDAGAPLAAPLQVTGQAYINHATGRYTRFPYLLEDVDAYLQFDNDRVNVEYLQGRGAGTSTFRITGYIAPPDKDAKFHLEVTGFNVPLDDRLRAALKPAELQAFDALFNAPSAERMARGGLLPDQKMLEQLTVRRDAATAQRAELKRGGEADPQAVAALEREIAQLERSIKAGPFVTGGTVDMQLTLDRALGPEQPTDVRGFIDVKSAGLIFDRFPYPLRGVGGRLKWEPDRVSIEPGADALGVRFVTPWGGSGSLTGSIAFPKMDDTTGRKLRPDVSLAVVDEPANPAVYAAIPYSKAELEHDPELATDWPGVARSKAGRIVEGIGLAGTSAYRGHIGTRDDGKIDWNFSVALNGCTASPNMHLAEALTARGPLWPTGLTLSDLKGEVNVRREGVSWNNITGASGDMLAAISGLIPFHADNTPADKAAGSFVAVELNNASIDRSALNMLSAANAKTADDMWDRFQPQGRFDATIRWQSDAPPGESAVLTLKPRDVSVVMGGERVALHGQEKDGAGGGAARIDGHAVHFDDLTLELSCLAAPQSGTVNLHGAWTFAGPAPGLALTGTWRDAHLESPIVPEALRLAGDDDHAARYAAMHPAGTFDASFSVDRADADLPLDYNIEFNPHALEYTLRGKRLQSTIAAGSAAFTPGLLTLHQISGRTAGNALFTLDGNVSTQVPIEAMLAFNYQGPLRSDEVAAFLPDAVNDTIASLQFHDSPFGEKGATSRLSNGSLRLRQSSGGWQTDFNGRLEARSASFLGGVQFSDVDGSLDLDISHETGRPLRLSAITRASHANVFGQEVTDVEAPMTLNEAGDTLEIPSAQARSGAGAVSCSASVGIGADKRDYQVRVDLVGVPLGGILRLPGGDAGNDPGVAMGAADAPPPSSSTPPSVPPDNKPDARDRRKSPTGQVFSSITLSGTRDDAASKRGRGVIRVLNGHLSSIPLALQAIQVMQFTLPLNGNLDYADADMYIVGDVAHFERILFESTLGKNAALQLMGQGTINLRTMEVNARFRSRSGVAIVRDIVGGISDMLYEIEVTGPLSDPKARVVPLP